jgi:phosphohistidine phosphatase
MKLYFLRHADALAGVPDDDRILSPKGREQSAAIAEFLEEINVEFDVAYSSPLVRARETAEIVLPITNHRVWVKLELVDALRNETSQKDFDKWFRSLPDAKHVLLVGHNPTISERVSRLLAVDNPESFHMPKGGLACLKTEDRKGATLEFFVSPKVL